MSTVFKVGDRVTLADEGMMDLFGPEPDRTVRVGGSDQTVTFRGGPHAHTGRAIRVQRGSAGTVTDVVGSRGRVRYFVRLDGESADIWVWPRQLRPRQIPWKRAI